MIGYNDTVHLAPAVTGSLLYFLGLGLVRPAYDHVMKCSHLFNLLQARGAISVSERVGYVGRIRGLACKVAQAYVEKLEAASPKLVDAKA